MRPFRVDVPELEVEQLKQRLVRTRWPDDLPDVGWERGVSAPYMRDLVDYWAHEFSWRQQEKRLNRFPQFVTNINGATIHFIHVRSPEADAIPLLVTHGWPGSLYEFLDVIGPLSDPAAFGATGQAYHLVLPSLPGFGFSMPYAGPGWGVPEVADAWAALMGRLGYSEYISQGADFGIGVNFALGMMAPPGLRAVLLNGLPSMFVSESDTQRSVLTEDDQARMRRSDRFMRELAGSMSLQSTRPNTIAYSLSDSPVGLLAWVVEKFKDWTDNSGSPEDAVKRDDMLAIVSSYWFAKSAGTSAQFYYEISDSLPINSRYGRYEPINVPLGVGVFPEAPFVPVRGLIERDLPSLMWWEEYDRGGNFAALEEPDLYVRMIRGFTESLGRFDARRVASNG